MKTRTLILSILVTACSSSGGSTQPDAHIMGMPDAHPTADAHPMADAAATADAGPQACTLSGPYAPAMALTNPGTNALQQGSTTQRVLQWGGPLNADAKPDVVFISLWDGYGAFMGGTIHTGTFTLGGAEGDFTSCGVCVLMGGDYDPTTMMTTQDFIATGGTLTVTSLSPFQGTLTNATFKHVKLPTMTMPMQMDVADGCAATITSVMFNGMITMM
jgi:hypothetical protein